MFFYLLSRVNPIINYGGEPSSKRRSTFYRSSWALTLTSPRIATGPYSSLLAGDLDSLVAHGFLNEDIESFDRNVFGEIRRHTYFLTDDAEELWSDIENAPEFPEWKRELDRINAHEIAHDFNKLSIAAKVHYIVSWRGKRTIEQVQKVAREYGWDVSTEDIEGVLSFLTELELVTPDESDDIPF